MKWNTEWVDLEAINRMVAECWRLNDSQLKDYAKQLRKQQDLIFTSHLGIAFVDILEEIASGQTQKNWSGIQKDVKLIQDLITQGLQWDEETWKNKYGELLEDKSFHTALKQAFLELLADRLEMNLSVEQKQLRQDIRQIQKLCERYRFENNEQFQSAARYVQKEQSEIFTSWLGEAFVGQVKVQSKKRAKQSKKEAKTSQKTTPEKENIILDAAKTEQLSLGEEEFENALLDSDQIDNISLDEVYMEAMQMADEYNHKTEPELLSQIQDSPGTKKTRKKKREKKERKTRISKIAICLLVIICCLFAGGIYIAMQTDGNRMVERVRQLLQGAMEIEATVETALLDEEQLSAGQNNTNEPDQEKLQLKLLPLQSESVGQEGGQETEDVSQNASQEKLEIEISQMDVQPNTGNHMAEDIPDILEKYRDFAKEYPDVYGWLKIPGTEIDQPVMQCKQDVTDYFYLHHNYKGQETVAGSLFVDSKSTIFPQDQNTVIYGHNMQNGHNFGILTNYEDPKFYQSHKTIYFDTIYETGTYEIVAVAKTRVLYQDETGFRYYYLFNYNDQDTFQKCKAFIEKNQLYDTGITLKKTDQTIMLSTCEYSIENGRLVVIARKK